MGACEFGPKLGPAESIDRIAIELVGPLAVEQRPGARLGTKREVGARGLRRLHQPLERIAGKIAVSQARGSFDQLEKRERGGPRIDGVYDHVARCSRRLLVTRQAVVQDGSRPVRRHLDRARTMPSCCRLLDRRLDQRRGFGLPSLQGSMPERAERRDPCTGRCRHALDLRDEHAEPRHVTRPACLQRQLVEVERQLRQRTRVANELSVPLADRAGASRVPREDARGRWEPAPRSHRNRRLPNCERHSSMRRRSKTSPSARSKSSRSSTQPAHHSESTRSWSAGWPSTSGQRMKRSSPRTSTS